MGQLTHRSSHPRSFDPDLKAQTTLHLVKDMDSPADVALPEVVEQYTKTCEVLREFKQCEEDAQMLIRARPILARVLDAHVPGVHMRDNSMDRRNEFGDVYALYCAINVVAHRGGRYLKFHAHANENDIFTAVPGHALRWLAKDVKRDDRLGKMRRALLSRIQAPHALRAQVRGAIAELRNKVAARRHQRHCATCRRCGRKKKVCQQELELAKNAILATEKEKKSQTDGLELTNADVNAMPEDELDSGMDESSSDDIDEWDDYTPYGLADPYTRTTACCNALAAHATAVLTKWFAELIDSPTAAKDEVPAKRARE